ncbi:hypothetical protein GQ53DRAFT_759015 [Thozetella sp. PMI_491]|nr:hypothetical protein GQ53DRAFT_759015 [Thozetella sp. PMI_491]
MFATLWPHAESPLPRWPSRITINGLLSIYSVVLKGCLAFVLSSCIAQLQWSWVATGPEREGDEGRALYDAVRYKDAAAGPWGSLKWLWKYRLSQPLTAAGAVLTLASLALDLILQQLITPVDCSWTVDGRVATVPRVNKMVAANDSLVANSYFTNVFRDALAGGINNLGNSVAASCPTANCTFPSAYGTLGVCSTFEDVSDKISLRTQCCDPSTSRLHRYHRVGIGDSNDTGGHEITPDILLASVKSEGLSSLDENFHILTLFGRTMLSDSGINPTTGQPLAGCQPPAVRNASEVCSPMAFQAQDLDDWRCRSYGAANCTIQHCIRVCNGTILNNQLREQLVDTVMLPRVDSSVTKKMDSTSSRADGLVDMQCASESEVAALAATGNFTTSSSSGMGGSSSNNNNNNSTRWQPITRNLVERSTTIELGALAQDLVARGCLYLMDQNSVLDIASLLEDAFIPKTEPKNEPKNLTATFDGDNFAASVRAAMPCGQVTVGLTALNDLTGPDWLKHIYNRGESSFSRLQETMDNLTENLTQLFRTSDMLQQEIAEGGVTTTGTCLHVRWGWLSYPVAITVLAILFLGMVVASSGGGQGSRGLQEQDRGPKTSEGMEREARGMRIRLVVNEAADPAAWKPQGP